MNRPVLTISAKTGWMTQSNRFSSIIAGSEKKKYTLLKKGELSYNHGNSKIAPFGTVFMLNNYSEALVPKVYHSFKANYYMNPYFLELYFHTKKLDPQLRKFISSSARMDGLLNITYKWFEKIFIFSPQLSEQNKLEKIFLLINKYISLQQRKLKDIQLLKKAYLKAIFKSNKSTYKLKDIADYRRGSFPQPYGNPKWYGGDGSLPFVQVIDVAKNLRLYNSTKQRISRLAQSKSVFVPKGSILITLQGSIGKVAITQYDAFVDRTLLIISNLKKDVDKYYFAYALQDKFNEEKRKAPGGTIKTITKNALSEFQIKLPKKDIQKKQSSILQKIDKDIYIINLKLSELSKFKQFLLQNMFI
jgi:type I restriction enzyme S subunit